ncbi:unnamed protein product [Staurois parvus]|uniref:Uncharacterized protein n=1 Tax=Staurois parvus TaxID=386267 RepID=A0ABN9EAB1_9NEOB|nr:unnamed protein product [Staurois parvus]
MNSVIPNEPVLVEVSDGTNQVIGISKPNVELCYDGQVSGQLLEEVHVPVELVDSSIAMGDNHSTLCTWSPDTALPNIEINSDKGVDVSDHEEKCKALVNVDIYDDEEKCEALVMSIIMMW